MASHITKVVIAAAGLGTRLMPMTKAMPKEMLPIIDKPIIQYVVEEAVAAGITDVIIVNNASKRSIEDHFDRQYHLEQKLRRHGKGELADRMKEVSELANFIYLRQKGPLGNATPVMNAANLLDGEPFLVLFADDFFNSAVPRSVQLMETFKSCQSPVISLVAIDRQRAANHGVAIVRREVTSGFELAGLVEKPQAEVAPAYRGKVYASTAGYIFTPAMLEYVKRLKPDQSGELVLANALHDYASDGNALYGRVIDGRWHDAGNRQTYLEAVVDVALDDPSVGPAFRAFLQERLRSDAQPSTMAPETDVAQLYLD